MKMAGTSNNAVSEGNLTRFHWRMVAVGGLHLLMASLDVGLLSFIFARLVLEWQLTPWHLGAIGMGNATGTLVGSASAGAIADRFGRKHALRLCLIMAGLGTVLGAFSWDYVSLAIFQFAAGTGIGGTAPTVGVLVSEFSPAQYRGRLSAMTEFFWVSGWLVAALAAYFIVPLWGWRAAFIFGGIPLLYASIQARILPESPRFLLTRGRTAEAHRLTETLRARYGVVLHLPSVTGVSQRRSIVSGLRELWARALAKRTACTWVLWFVLVYSWSGIFIWIPTLMATSGFSAVRTSEFMLVFTLAQFPPVALSVFTVDWLGRKWLLVPALLVCGLASYFFGTAESYPAILFLGAIIAGSNIIGWSVMPAYTAELFPTRLRGTGSGWAAASGRFGGITVPGVMALFLSSWGKGYQAVFVMFSIVLLVGALVVAVLGEETKGRTLEEISAHV